MKPIQALCCVVLAMACGVQAQARQERFVHKPQLPAKLSERHILDEVVIKFKEGSAVRLRDGRLVSLDGSTDTGRVMALAGTRTLRRFFQRPEADLDQERDEILARLPAGEQYPGELNLYFAVKTRGQEDSEALINALNEDPVVEVAYADWNPEEAEAFVRK
jgi:hypothetical protein